MLISGKDKLERMRDGRVIYIGAERVDDVTTHPALRAGAATVAGLYDLKADPAQRELFTFEENGELISLYWLRCRTRDDLRRRMRCMKAIADATHGLIGRSPDQVADQIVELAEQTGVDHLMFKCGWPGLAHEHTMRCLALLSQEVLPRVRKQIGPQRLATTAAAE